MDPNPFTNKTHLIRNGLWNLLGHSQPLLIGIVALPILIKYLGKDRFGILSIGWVIILWSGILAQGVALALTKRVSEASHPEEQAEIPFLAGTAILLLFLLGLLESLILAGLTPWLTLSILNIPEDLKKESQTFFYLLAAIIPLANISICLVGILEGQQRFRWINYVRIPAALLIFLVPISILFFTPFLPWLLMGALGVVVISVAAFWGLAVSTMPEKRFRVRLKKSELGQLVNFGKWVVLGNFLGSLTGNMAKIFIGALLTLEAVTYYDAANQVVMGLFIIPIALVQVMFPAFVSSFKSDPGQLLKLHNGALKSLFLVIFPIIFTIIAFAPEGLGIWLGPDFGKTSGPILRWLALGIYVASLNFIPGIFIQASGRPDLSAKLQLIILPIFTLTLLGSTKFYGIQGAAIVFAAQFLVGGVFIFLLARKIYPPIVQSGFQIIGSVGAGLMGFLIIVLISDLMARALIWLGILLVFFCLMWKLGLKSEDRIFLKRSFQWRRR